MEIAVFCPSYCLARKTVAGMGARLTEMNRACTEAAIKTALLNRGSYLIFSTAYKKWWKKEAELKIKMATKMRFDPNKIVIIPEVANTYVEVESISDILERREIKNLIVVAEKYHLPRVLRTLKKTLPQTTKIVTGLSVRSLKYEMALEPSLIKSIRAGSKILWILWNQLMYFLTPLLTKCPSTISAI